jgi:ring-1,2-phenylacetyl-CoA epoxidase subunit PaaD
VVSATTTTTLSASDLARARRIAAGVLDPELPVLTLADLGVLRAVVPDADGGLLVTITPTYSGCPAMETMRADLRTELAADGFDTVRIRTVLSPAWTTDWITEDGRRKLAEHGIAPPGRTPLRRGGPVPLNLTPPQRVVRCPLCDSADTEELSRFGATACKALRRCRSCAEPFEHIKEL